MRRPTAAHLKLLQFAQDGDSMFGAVPRMGWKEPRSRSCSTS